MKYSVIQYHENKNDDHKNYLHHCKSKVEHRRTLFLLHCRRCGKRETVLAALKRGAPSTIPLRKADDNTRRRRWICTHVVRVYIENELRYMVIIIILKNQYLCEVFSHTMLGKNTCGLSAQLSVKFGQPPALSRTTLVAFTGAAAATKVAALSASVVPPSFVDAAASLSATFAASEATSSGSSDCSTRGSDFCIDIIVF